MESQRKQQNEYIELRISDCSSEDENVQSRADRNRFDSGEAAASVYISWSSDEELGNENCQGLLNRSFFNQKSVTPGGLKRSNSARKAKLPNLCVKRKLHKEVETPPQVRRSLSCRSVPLKDKNSASRSPWRKVRKTFVTLRYQSSLPTIHTSPFSTDSKTTTKNRSLSEKSDGRSIEWSSSSSESGSPTRRPSHESTPTTTQKSTAPTELDLLVALIERENSSTKTPHSAVKTKKRRKRFLQGGYAERLQKLEEANRIERNFLQHDQQLGLQNGTRMRVLELKYAYGVHLATVELEQTNKNLTMDDAELAALKRIVIDADMAAHVKVGSKLEAFFDGNTKPYIIEKSDLARKDMIYVQPHKLLLL